MNETLIIAPCIYRLDNGLVLFSETAKDIGDRFEFDGAQTAVIALVPSPQGLVLQSQRMTASPFAGWAGKMTVYRSHIAAISNTVNMDFLTNTRKAISGIEVVAPGRGLDIVKGPHR